jgi:hypothetical protein
VKQGDSLSLLLFNFVVEYMIRKVQENQEGLEFNSEYQFLVHHSDINLFDKNIVMFTLFWKSYDLTASSHLRYCCQHISVHYYFTTPSLLCPVLVSCNKLTCSTPRGLFHIYFDTHLHTSHPHSLRLNSRLAITVLCM